MGILPRISYFPRSCPKSNPRPTIFVPVRLLLDRWRSPLLGLAVFAGAALGVFLLTADILHPSLDEGIYLEGAQRVLRGQVPYKDFFAYTGPFIYWIQAGIQAAFGRDLAPQRLPVALSFGLMAAGAYWIAASFGKRREGVAAAFVLLGMTMPSIYRFTINHRWISAGLMSVGIAMAVGAAGFRPARTGQSGGPPHKKADREIRPEWLWFGAGAAAAAAAWATPTCVALPGMMAGWILWRRERRPALLPLCAGVVAVSAPAVVWLAAHGALGPMCHRFLWAANRYSRANSVPYGYYPGGLHLDGLLRLASVARLLAPAALMPGALLLGAYAVLRRRWKEPHGLLLLLAFGMLLTSYPRWDVNQLLFVTPPFYALLALWVGEFVPRPARVALFGGAVCLAGAYFVQAAAAVDGFSGFFSRAGYLRHTEEDGLALEALEKRIPEGESAFVFPYFPVIGYILGTRNPTAYSYLQPGMMSAEDEAAALAQLRAAPPRFVLLQYLPDDQVLDVWPHSDRTQLHFDSIRRFIRENYAEVERVGSEYFRLTVMERSR